VVEVHDDAMRAGEKVLVVDDLLATGGTAEAGIKLIERLGAEVIGCAFVVDLPDLGGRASGWRRWEWMFMPCAPLRGFNAR
jgi:adenine phosphoribosyltransferase